MGQVKTINTDGALQRVISGQMRICSIDSEKNYEVELLLINSLVNRNNWRYTRLAEHLDDVEDTPILFSHAKGDHAFKMKRDPRTGKEYASFVDADSEKPVGWIPKTVRGDRNARLVNVNGVEWLSARGFLPRFYNKELIEELESNNGQMDISVETLVTEYHMEDGVEVEDKWILAGTTILKKGVAPAVKGASIRKLAFDDNALETIKLKVASLAKSDLIEPQTQKENPKEIKKKMKVRNVEDVKALFPKYTVLAVEKGNVALISDNDRLCSYSFHGDEDTVIPEEIKEVAVNAAIGEGDSAISVSFDKIFGTMHAQLNAYRSALDKANALNGELQTKVAAMEKAEADRRKEAARKAIKARVQEVVEIYPEISEHDFDDMLGEDKIAEYALLEKDGRYVGEEVAVRDVDARCMGKVLSAEKARKNAAETKKAWEYANGTVAPMDAIEEALSKYDKTK